MTRALQIGKKHRLVPLERDQWGRPYVYLAQYTGAAGGGGTGLFTSLDAAIFYLITGIGNDVDWSNFPDPSRKYPYEERNGNDNPPLNPAFVVERMGIYGKPVKGTVMRMAAATDWRVGNGMAEFGRRLFAQLTGRDEVELSGKGGLLTGKVGR